MRPLGGHHSGYNFPAQVPGQYFGQMPGLNSGGAPGHYGPPYGQYSEFPGAGQFGQQPPPTDPPLYGSPRYNEIQPSVPIKSRDEIKSESKKGVLSETNILLIGIGAIFVAVVVIIGAVICIKKSIKRRTESNVYNFPSKSTYRNKPV